MEQLLAIAASLVLIHYPASAQSSDPVHVSIEQSLGLIKYVDVVMDDQVKGGCWTNSSAIRAATRLKFEREDIPVLDESPAYYTPAAVQVLVSSLGLKTDNGLCATYAKVQVARPTFEEWGGANDGQAFRLIGWGIAFEASSVFVAGKNNNDQIEGFVDEATNDLLADILSQRRSEFVEQFFEALPALRDRPKTVAELEE